MNDAPCKGCRDRAIGCHATCDKYIAFDTERQKEREYRHRYALERAANYEGIERFKNGDYGYVRAIGASQTKYNKRPHMKRYKGADMDADEGGMDQIKR